jgi:hypothetical protein
MPSIPVGTAPVPVVGDNAARQAFSVRNASTAGQVIYIDNVKPDGLTTGNAAHPLSVGESLNFSHGQRSPALGLLRCTIRSIMSGRGYEGCH